MKLIYLVLSGFALLMTLPGTGCISIARSSQASRIVRIYKAHSLYENGKLKTEGASELLSNEEKAVIVSAYDELDDFKTKPSWWVNLSADMDKSSDYRRSINFENLFGFEYSYSKYKKLAKKENVDFYYGINLSAPDDFSMDVKDFSVLYSFSECSSDQYSGVYGIVSFAGGKKLDFTKELKEYLLANSSKTDESIHFMEEKEEPLTLKKDGWTATFTKLNIVMKEGADGFYRFWVSGYICK